MKRAAPLALFALLTALPLHAQTVFEIEAGGGYTLVDVEGVAVSEGAIAQDWSQPSYRFAARALFGGGSGITFGAEVSHQYLYWYSVRIPFGSQPIRREYDVTATSAQGLLRLDAGGASLDLGAGFAYLEEAVPLASVAIGWGVFDNFAVKLRADGIIATEPTVPVGIAFSYAFGRR